MNIFSIKNEKLGFFNRPIYCETEKEALSYIQNVLMSDADRALLGLKDDLALYCLGGINFETGGIIPYVPEKVCDLADIFASIPPDSIPRDSKALSEAIKRLGDRLIATDNKLREIEEVLSKCKKKK